MITLNLKYLTENQKNHISELEKLGNIVDTIDEIDLWYEDDLKREFKQNLSPHDWHGKIEYFDLYRFLKNNN